VDVAVAAAAAVVVAVAVAIAVAAPPAAVAAVDKATLTSPFCHFCTGWRSSQHIGNCLLTFAIWPRSFVAVVNGFSFFFAIVCSS